MKSRETRSCKADVVYHLSPQIHDSAAEEILLLSDSFNKLNLEWEDDTVFEERVVHSPQPSFATPVTVVVDGARAATSSAQVETVYTDKASVIPIDIVDVTDVTTVSRAHTQLDLITTSVATPTVSPEVVYIAPHSETITTPTTSV